MIAWIDFGAGKKAQQEQPGHCRVAVQVDYITREVLNNKQCEPADKATLANITLAGVRAFLLCGDSTLYHMPGSRTVSHARPIHSTCDY